MKWGRCSAEELADYLGVTDRVVRDLAVRDIIVKDDAGYDLKASIRKYCEHLRATASGRGNEEGVASLSGERARMAREQADALALKNKTMRGELVDAAEVEREWRGVLSTVRAAMLAVPSRVHQRLGHLTAQNVLVIENEIRDALQETAHDVAAE